MPFSNNGSRFGLSPGPPEPGIPPIRTAEKVAIPRFRGNAATNLFDLRHLRRKFHPNQPQRQRRRPRRSRIRRMRQAFAGDLPQQNGWRQVTSAWLRHLQPVRNHRATLHETPSQPAANSASAGDILLNHANSGCPISAVENRPSNCPKSSGKSNIKCLSPVIHAEFGMDATQWSLWGRHHQAAIARTLHQRRGQVQAQHWARSSCGRKQQPPPAGTTIGRPHQPAGFPSAA